MVSTDIVDIAQIEMPCKYEYVCDSPKGCRGRHYMAWITVLDVPSYQTKILMEALNGPDRGLWFTVTPANFITRYAKIIEFEAVGTVVEPTGTPGEVGILGNVADFITRGTDELLKGKQ